ncbi:hypothetical protein NP568_24885, partial [Vibrio parahaemolyticus]|nr:hypothetical protein [Vibrio parahaemolyticus]
ERNSTPSTNFERAMMESTNRSVPISNTVPLLAAITLALFLVPVKFAVGGVALAPYEIASLISVC